MTGGTLRPHLWRGLLPERVAHDLAERWDEPHRFFHDTGHLVDGLSALARLGGGRTERIAFWFHDAVHTGTSPRDERASADLAGKLLAGVLPEPDVAEVARLVLLTVRHRPREADEPGRRMCDADLSWLGSAWDDYVDHTAGLRLESPHLDTDEWSRSRARDVIRMLKRDWLFSTWQARHLWEDRARANMVRELACLG